MSDNKPSSLETKVAQLQGEIVAIHGYVEALLHSHSKDHQERIHEAVSKAVGKAVESYSPDNPLDNASKESALAYVKGRRENS
ncbi:hypothetical protein [Carnimonas bestiolae]|uniref:hypothetical protein n=1 Tax=Carnimonas bestiolae TaxID=3402172 RepID=UPI003EDBFB40